MSYKNASIMNVLMVFALGLSVPAIANAGKIKEKKRRLVLQRNGMRSLRLFLPSS